MSSVLVERSITLLERGHETCQKDNMSEWEQLARGEIYEKCKSMRENERPRAAAHEQDTEEMAKICAFVICLDDVIGICTSKWIRRQMDGNHSSYQCRQVFALLQSMRLPTHNIIASKFNLLMLA
ncbi:hypothetical protein AC1031_002240 [Aphanomyces cochlioides]|nr:hypothetical protein AC1031_002240 [Aphanomyces cochlioides]